MKEEEGKKKEKRKKKPSEDQTSEKEEEKKSQMVKRCAKWVPHVCLITKIPLSYKLWKLKTAKRCFQFP